MNNEKIAYIPSLFVFILTIFFFFHPNIIFAKTPYNAVASKLKENTTTGVFNPSSDQLKENTTIEGIISGKNGSTFLLKLPTEDSGYNVLFGKETEITKNGKLSTSKSLVKGLSAKVTGTLDTSTYTLKATKIELGSKSETKTVTKPETPKKEKIKNDTETKPEKLAAKEKSTKKQISQSQKQGNKNTDVKILQEKLVTLGLLSKNGATGYYGPETAKAVKQFQKTNKLDQTGSVGPKTRDLLNK